SGPLVMSYFLGLSLIHIPGALAYIGAASGDSHQDTVETGIAALLLGMTCLLAGAIAAQWLAPPIKAQARPPMACDDGAGLKMVAIGVASYFVALPMATFVPSATSIASAAGSLLIVGLWSHFHRIQKRGNRGGMTGSLFLLPLLPASTIIAGGFAGFGTFWM